MAWTYTGDPASSDKDAVRFLVGATDSGEALATDEEILWALTEEVNKYGAAALVAESLASYFATQADLVKLGPIWEQYTKRSSDYTAKAKQLRNKAGSKATFEVYAGGIDVSDKIDHYNDATLVQPEFTKGLFDRSDTDTSTTDPRYS